MKRLALSEGTVTRARILRRDATAAERALWHGLRTAFASARFRRQVPLGPYFADFASYAHRLVIEVDGGRHGDAHAYGTARTRFLESEGYRVIRVWNNDVLANLEGVLTQIGQALQIPSPSWGGQGGGPAASAAEKTTTPASAAEKASPLSDSAALSWAADAARPHPNPPHKGEGA